MKVLLVDDHPLILLALKTVIEGMGENVSVVVADCAEAARIAIRRHADFHLVLLDLAMPNMNGADTLKEIRKEWGPMPIILHTGFADGELMKQALAFSLERKQGLEQGMQQGEQRGELRGELQALKRLLTKKFGELPLALIAQLKAADLPQIEVWFDRTVDATALQSVFQAH